jgi:hypothetical protein
MTVYRLIKNGEPAISVGAIYRIRESDEDRSPSSVLGTA